MSQCLSTKRLSLHRELTDTLVRLRRARTLRDEEEVEISEQRLDALLDRLLTLNAEGDDE